MSADTYDPPTGPGRYLRFDEQPRPLSGRTTPWWQVCTTRDRWCVGQVHWHAPWRRYAFFPAKTALFDAACLDEIATFLRDETTKRKQTWSGRTSRGGRDVGKS